MAYAFWLRQWLQLVPISTDGFWPEPAAISQLYLTRE